MRGVTTILSVLGLSLLNKINGEYVVALTDKTFDDHIAKNKYVLAEFYAPWCGHCKQLAPEYEKAAEKLAAEDVEGGLSIVKIDATEEKELGTRFEVQGFPTLKWIVNGEASDYGGGRTESEIVAWVSKKTGPATVPITDQASFDAFKKKGDVVVFGCFSAADSDEAKAFVSAAEIDDEATYGLAIGDDACKLGEATSPKVVVFRSFEAPDEPRVECDGEFTREGINTCVSANILPLIVPFSQANAPKIFGGSIKQHCLLFINDATKDSTLEMARTVATANKGKYLFVTVAESDDRILEFFGIKGDMLPTARIVVMGDAGMKKFAIPGDLSADELTAFVNSHSEGKLTPDLKSEDDIADEDQKDAVWVLVGKNHDRVVFNDDKHVFVEYYAPWCGHCKKLAPEYEKLGEHYKDNEDVIIAKMDSTANEVESVSVSGFPTLKFYPKGAKEPVDFDGGRDFEGMKTYIDGKI